MESESRGSSRGEHQVEVEASADGQDPVHGREVQRRERILLSSSARFSRAALCGAFLSQSPGARSGEIAAVLCGWETYHFDWDALVEDTCCKLLRGGQVLPR